ncbi:MAG: hypothetical protein ACP5Q3_13865, partial [bacterium]
MANCWLFRQTHLVKGRKRLIDQNNTDLKFLRYGRIRLEKGDNPINIESGAEEIGLICLYGEGEVEVGGQSFKMTKYDALYLPIQSRCRISSAGLFDLAECAA